MAKAFSLSNDNVMINFTENYCDTSESLINSNGFKTILTKYIDRIRDKETYSYRYIESNIIEKDHKILINDLISIFKILLVFNIDEVKELKPSYKQFLDDKDMVLSLVEGLYNYWRKLERYTIVQNNKTENGYQNINFIDANNNFSNLILSTYRKLLESISGSKPKVYRQLPAGGNAGVILSKFKWCCPEDYKSLIKIPFIQSIVLDTPFITYPKRNTRDGIFSETKENPISFCTINSDHMFCYPAKVGSLLAFIYFHRDFMSHGVSLCNLFELANEDEFKDKKPDIIYVFGAKDNNQEISTVFYDDKENDIMFGYVNHNSNIDYFGYMKKMTLTLHNLIMIKRGYLPIHGAMVKVTTKYNKTANILIMGDSGAGKSECLEALRNLSEDYISDMTIIFDDMGVIKISGDECPLAYGTEIGAFVRLDDLDAGYAFKQIDRSIFMNPDKINARLIIPVSTYKEITLGYPIDLFLYANNYDDSGTELEYFNSSMEALPVFIDGTRFAKGTTTEKGLVKTYFANPFGPVQKSEDMDKLLPIYFNKFFETGVKVGMLRTRLGIPGMEKQGPIKAATKLLEELK